jgi:CspA family cold shock protein
MGRGNDHRDRRRQFGGQAADPWGDYAPPPSFERPSQFQTSRASANVESEARVKWFNSEKGFGFIEMTDGSGEAFLHVRQVEAAGLKTLESGTTLVVSLGQGQKGMQVNEIISVDTSTAEPEPARRGPRPSRDQFGRSGSPRPESSRPPEISQDIAGTVKWFDPVKGFGFVSVEGENKDLFVHISVVERAGLGALEPGQAVRVSVVEGRKGREVGSIELV